MGNAGQQSFDPNFVESQMTLLPRWFGIVAVVVTFGVINSPATHGSTLEAVVPAYFYPSGIGLTYWNQMTTAAATIPITAILNPASGPGATSDPNYASAVDALRAAGGKVMGYVHTSYGTRSSATVLAEVNSYASFYNLDGIFVDEMDNTLGSLSYYTGLYSSIKTAHPTWSVFGNPGTTTLEPYLTGPAADVLTVFEGDGVNYPTYTPSSWNFSYDRSHFAHLIYNVSTAAVMQSDVALAAARNARYVYVTDDNLPNPWDTLPSYWNQEVSTIAVLNAVPEPKTLTLLSCALLSCGLWQLRRRLWSTSSLFQAREKVRRSKADCRATGQATTR
jgi:spherulation-specific family 4 protein